MIKTEDLGIDIADLDARALSDEAFEFEYIRPDGAGSGVFISVLGSQSDKVSSEINQLVNARRRKDAVAARKSSGARPESAEFTPVEDDVEFGQRLSAVRIVGWRGIKQPYTPDLALKLCQSNAELSAQTLAASNELSNFMKVSSPK